MMKPWSLGTMSLLHICIFWVQGRAQRWHENIWYQRRGPVLMSAFGPNPQTSIQACSSRDGLDNPEKCLLLSKHLLCVLFH